MADLIQENGLATDQGTYFGVKFGVINKNIDVVHHLILYGCAAKPKGNIFNAPSETNEGTETIKNVPPHVCMYIFFKNHRSFSTTLL